MENKLRRGLALLMTLIMLISCAPMDALAAIVPVSGGTQTSSGVSLKSIVKPPVATTTYVFMNGTEEFARQILKNGEALNNPGTPDSGSPNKEFTGWRDGDNNAPVFGAVTVTDTKTITYHAQFADVYFVFFTNEKGEVMVTKKGANGDTISTDGVTYPVGNEQSIVGWKDASGNLVSSVTLNGRDVTLTAKVENGHWITYDSQGGTYVAPAFVKGNGTTTAPAAPTRPGYTFRHWSAAVGGAAFTFGQPLDQALTLHAVWTANTDTRYTVIHWQENADDDEYSYAESETKTGATGAQTSAAAKSYTGFTVQTIAQQTIAGDGSTIVNVYYKRNTYTLTFRELTCERWHTHRDSCYKVRKTITAKYQADIHGNFPIKDGTETIWWTVPDNCQSFVSGNYLGSIDTMPAENITFSKKASESGAKLYYYVETLDGAAGDIAYNGKNYKLYKEIDLEYSTSTSLTYAEEFHPITGFTQGDSDPYLPVNGKVRMNRNNYLYYTRNSYNIVYVSGGEKVNTASKKFEQSIADAGSYTPPVKPVGQEDYVFGGWYADEATTKPYDFTGKTMPAQNVTVYAKWNKPVYNGTIYLTIEGTGSSIRINVPKGDTIETALNEKQAEIMAQVGEGYTWRGWRTGKDGTGEPFNPQTQITTDITLYPYYTKDGTFTVEYVSGKNDVTAPVDGKSYAEGSFADLMSPGALVSGDGEYFLGWSDGAATYQPRDKYQIKSNHADEQNVITLTAKWGARPAGTTLTYKANGGAGEDVVENLANNATVTTKPGTTFSRVGYTFKGWDTNPKGEGSIAPNTQVQVDNKDGENVLYAIWQANTNTKYTVEFYYQNTDGTYTLNHSDERTTTTDTTVSVTEADKAAKENNKYVFEADNKNNVLSGNVAGNGSLVLKLYFKLNTASYTIHHYLKGTTVKVAEDQTGAMTIGEELTANRSNALYAAYAAAEVADYDPNQTITIAADESKNVITVYYTVPLTITAGDAEKTYDGQPLTQPDFKMEGLVNGDTKENFTLSMTAESTITNAGSTPNVINTDTVEYNGGAIPSYYNVSYNPGTLTVNKASATVTITCVNKTTVYDGTQHEANGYNYSFTGKQNEITISLKPNVLAIARRTDVGTTYMGLTKDSFTVTSANYDVTINAVIDGYVTITPVTDKVTVTVTENGAIVTYDGNEHSVKGYKSMTADNKLYDVTTSVKTTETAAWTATGTDAGEYPVGVAAGDFENINKNFTNVAFVIVDGVLKINPITENTITITANSETKVYDGTPLTDGGFTFTEGVLVKGDVLTAVVEGSATNVGDPGVNKVTSYVVTRGNKDVTGNYTFTDSVDGKLTINKRTVTLTSETASKEYDGTPLTKPDVAVTGDGFVDGEVSDITATGSVTFVHEGEVPNAITYTTGANYKESNYTISKNEGKLSITKRGGEGKTITVTAANGEKVYDGTPLTDNRFDYTEGVLVDGDVLTAVVEGSQTDVGSSDNVVTSYKVTRGETDVTSSYTFADSVKGALTVTLRGVTFTGESKSLPYTGGMQSITGITQSGLVEGHRYEGLTYKAEGQNVGSYDGAFSGDVVIKDAQGNDVTKNYNVTKTPGTLTITNASFTVTFTGESAEKVYNGKEQSITGITVAGLKTGHRYEGLTYEAKGTDKGEYVGAFTGTVKILDENNVDVTENYAVTKTPGKLMITAVTDEVVVTITGHKDTVTYDGKEHPVTGYDVSISNELYKEADFTFTGSAEVKATNASDTAYAMGLKDTDFANKNGNFSNVTFKVTDGELVINKRPVMVYAEKLEYAYDYANPAVHPADDVARYTVEAANGDRGLLTGDALNADVLYDGQSTQTLIGVYQAVAQIAAAKITNANGDVTANYAIEKVDSTLTITGEDPLDPGKETTSVQTNYTVGDVIEYKIAVKNVSKGEATHVVVTDSMAEIQPGTGYSVSDNGHTATIASIPAGGSVVLTAMHTVTAEDVENAYAGDANGSLTNVANIKFGDWNKDVEGDHDELNDTYEYVVRYYWNNYTSVQPHEEKKLTAMVGMEVTEVPAAIDGYTPVSADSKKLTISADQSKNVIEFYYYKNVELTANSKTETYDGTEKQVNGFTVKGENKDQDDQTIAADFSAITVGAKDIDAGEYPANFAENTVGTVDKTGRYIVAAANNGKLVINPVTGQLIIITANSARKTYDGTPLTDNNFTFTQGVLADGDVLTAVVEGSATNVGDEGKNVVKSYAVKRGETDVTKNYTFGNSIDGKLTINPRKVTLTSETASKEYDGKPLTKPVVTVTGDGFVTGEGATYTFTGSQTVVGSSANAFTYTLNEGTNAGNYEVAKTEGMLTVTQNEKAITVTANSHTWEYDGQPHSDGGYTVEYDGQTYKVEAGKTVTLQTGDIVKAKITKTVTNVSDSAPNNNTIDELTIVNAAGEDTKGQYKTVTLIPGTLTITKRGAGEEKVKITAADNTVEYDGQPHGAKLNAANQIEVGTSFTVTNLADGHSVKTLAIDGSETDAGVYANKLVPGNAVIVDGNGVEVTANYDITYVSGTLTITQRGSGDMKVVLTAANNTVVYDGQPHGVKLNDKGEIEAGVSYTITNLADGHKVQTVAIDGTETAVGEYEDRLVPSGAKIVDAAGNDVTRNYVVGYEKGKLTITSPDTVIVTISGNKDRVEYDGQKHEVNGYVVKSISNALYTDADFGFAEGAAAHAEGTDAGEYPMNLTKDSFVNKNTNFSAVTFVVTDGGLTITKRGAGEEKVKITAADNTVYYDGQPHGAKLNAAGQIEVNVSYTTEYLAPGHKVQSVVIDGSRTKVGLYKDELVPKSAVIVDKTDKDVTENYEITYVPGTLEIRKNETEIKVTANSHTWEYDGQAHSDGGYTVTYGNESYTVKAGESATLSTGDKVTAVVKGQVKDVDDTKAGNNEIVEWSVEHRDFYNNVTPANGTLTITPRKVTLTSASDSKPYDGTPLTNPEVAVTGDGFVAGEVSDIKATGSVTYVSQGEVDNLITFTKKEGFKDSNYEIEERIGKLSIEALDVTIIITGPSAIREYKPGVTHTIVTGGSELDFVYGSDKVDGKIGVKGMVKGDKILPGTLKHTLEGMYVGEYEGVFTLFDSNGKKADKPTVMHDGVDVTENYKFSYNPGKLTITGKHMDGGKEVENEVPEKNYLLGQKIPFTITVRSVSKDELKEVTVTDPTATILPDRNTANPAYTVSEDEHTATITSLAPEAEVIVYAEHEVTEDDIINRYTNEATINWGDDVVEVSKTPSIEEKNPEAELVKEIVLQDGQDENHKFKLGETVYFKITVTNTGNVTLNEYEVKEVLPGAAFIDGTGYTLNNDKTVATIEKMEPVKDGQEAPDSNQIVLYAQYTIKEEDLGNKELKNIVTADNSKPGEVPIPVDEAKSVSGQKIWKDEGNAFNTRPASITLTLMRKLGQNGAAEQYRTMQLGSNGSWRYSFDHLPKHDAQENEYFYWVVEEPVTGYDTAYETKDESHCDIVNNLQTYTLTIHYWQHKLGDTKMEQAFPDYVATLYYKQPYDVESPEREGIILDDMSQARISGTMPVHDLVIDVYYHRIAYRLTIHYIYQDGTMAHEDYTWTYWFNSTYNVPSPIIPGFTPSIDVIAGRMPSHGLELTVVYVGDGEIVIPDEDTSLGFKSYLNAGECFE